MLALITASTVLASLILSLAVLPAGHVSHARRL